MWFHCGNGSDPEDSDSDESHSDEDSEESYNFGWFGRRRRSPSPKPPSKRNSIRKDVGSEDEEERPAGDLRTEIFSTLKLVKTPSAFAYSAVDSSLPNPVLHVPPHGTLGLPLSTDDAKKIISQASQSPFGKGEKTLVDTTVRKSWELNPKQFSLKNKAAWNKVMKKILDAVTTGLGLQTGTTSVSAELYKLLLYEPGAFFKPHKDSEKAPGMFATLVVCLPSQHKGGKLVLTHGSEKYEFETARSSSSSLSYAAWYADITHEVQQVASGYRLMLTYNLIRKSGFEIPSYNLVCEPVNRLSMLLEQYKEKDDQPPILVHKLEHKYTKASFKLKTLKPRDFAQVQTLSQLATKLGFDIYLATWQLLVDTNTEFSSDDDCKYQSLENIVELDGKLAMESLECPDGALINPKPRKLDKPDQTNREAYTGNEGTPIQYWYRDAVVFLVPPSKRLNFVCKFKSSCDDESIFEPLFCKLMQEYSKDPDQKPRVEQMCELALNQKTDRYSYRSISESKFPYFKQVVATALDLGRLDLFDKACKMSKDKITLYNASLLGRWAANNGVDTMTDRLMKGVEVASSVAEKIEFLEAVAEGFEKAESKPSAAERANLKQWSDEAIFSVVAELEKLTKDDCSSLAQLCKTIDWKQFQSKVQPVISKAIVSGKIAFIKELMSTLKQKFDKKQRSFIEMIIHNVWNDFDFDVERPKSKSYYSWEEEKKPVSLNENDVLNIVESTITILSSESVSTIIIPAMLSAIPIASKECSEKLFIPLVQMILKNQLPGFKLKTKDAPPPSHKRLVQALLTKFLLANVGHEPQVPTNWYVRSSSSWCCRNCSAIIKFLEDPCKESLDYPCSKSESKHLDYEFTANHVKSKSFYDVTTTWRDKKPRYVWQIKKHRREYEAAKVEWKKNVASAGQTLNTLENSEPVNGRLKAYLESYSSTILNVEVEKLPDLESLVTMPETDENVAHNQLTETGCKRGKSNTHLLEDEPAKRPKS